MFSAGATALLSLFLEDLLPKDDPQARFDFWRVLFLCFSLFLVWFLVRRRYKVRQASATLFSVQVLDEAMRDRTQEQGQNSRAVAAEQHMSIRVLHRWLDLETSTSNDVIDVEEACREAGAQLQLLVNTTPDDGKHSVAPNMPWPIAMAIGGYLPARTHDFQMVELATQKGKPERKFDLQYLSEVGLAKLDIQEESIEDPLGERIGVHIGLAGHAHEFHKHRIRHFRAAGVSSCYTTGPEEVLNGEDRSSDYTGEELNELSKMVTAQLFRIKEKHPDDELVVFANMPKTVSLAVGWQLMHYRGSFYRKTYLMHYGTENETYIPMRVRSSQPTAGFSVRQIRGADA
ncbi:hypothetical protein [Saccharopolyspora sp. NPDC002376]